MAVSWDKVRATFGSELAVSAQCRGGAVPYPCPVPPPPNKQPKKQGRWEREAAPYSGGTEHGVPRQK